MVSQTFFLHSFLLTYFYDVFSLNNNVTSSLETGVVSFKIFTVYIFSDLLSVKKEKKKKTVVGHYTYIIRNQDCLSSFNNQVLLNNAVFKTILLFLKTITHSKTNHVYIYLFTSLIWRNFISTKASELENITEEKRILSYTQNVTYDRKTTWIFIQISKIEFLSPRKRKIFFCGNAKPNKTWNLKNILTRRRCVMQYTL